jgi:hypothetical protein
MERTIRTDFDELVTPLLGLAETMLQDTGGFRPFGARLAAGGQLALVDIAPTLAEPSSPLMVDALYATFRLAARTGTIRACAVCWDAVVPRAEGGGLMDAIAIDLEHRDGDPAVVVCGYQRERSGGILFEEPVTIAGRRHVFGNVQLT